MTSKTFESIDQTRQLHVKPLDKHVILVINYKDAGRSGLTISHSDAPALALAILEAAGAHKDSQDFLGGAVEQLKFHIGEQERITAEARERAELEAEALMLANSAVLAVGNPPYPSIEHMSDTSLRKWLAVARRAREMRAEK